MISIYTRDYNTRDRAVVTRTIATERCSLGSYVTNGAYTRPRCNPKTTRGDDYNAPISQISFIVAFVAQENQSA